jgi:hypothetical protein
VLLVLALLGLLFVSLVATLMAVRFYNHASFIGAMPVASPERASWASTGARYVRKAGILYGVGLRQLVLVLPLVAALFLPRAGPVAAVIVAAALFSFDCVGGELGPATCETAARRPSAASPAAGPSAPHCSVDSAGSTSTRTKSASAGTSCR